MFCEHVKFTRNMVGEEIAKGLAKFLQNSKYQSTTVATAHVLTPSSSATPSTSVAQPSYDMLLNYFGGQTPLAHNTSITFYMPESIPMTEPPPPKKAEVHLPRSYRVVLDEARMLQTQHKAYNTMMFKL
jgi:hypothetical protein